MIKLLSNTPLGPSVAEPPVAEELGLGIFPCCWPTPLDVLLLPTASGVLF